MKQKDNQNTNNKACTCGEDCNCTPKDNCGCGGQTSEHHNDCGCGSKHAHDNCNCKQNNDDCKCENTNKCDCNHEHGEHCNCDQTNEDQAQEQFKQLFAELTSALAKTEKELKQAKDEMLNNQRIAVSYKKDLERYKERNKNIESDAVNNATENVAMQIIPILDQFETALSSTKEGAEKQGYNMIFTSLKKAITNMGVAEIEAIGQQFDSNLHNAISKTAVTDKAKDNVVTSVYQKGYKLMSNDKIIRYAMVEIGEYTK